MAGFLQTPPRLPDAWIGDRALRESLRFHLGDDLYATAEDVLADAGATATSDEVLALARRAENEPPELTHYSTWGERIDEIRVSSAYTELGRLGVRMGVTALPYEDSPFRDKARLVWAGLIALWGPSSALYSCPVAMTDGAARTLLLHGDLDDIAVVGRLTTRDPDAAWTSGQWMTETAGGSDVGRTGTLARRDASGTWRLYGRKWFTSSTTSEMALTLARPEGAPDGSRGLALFRVHRLLDDGTPNAIYVRRLKDKLGTRALPTAELELEGALAHPIGDPYEGGGVRRISTMLNITRIHNSLGAVGALSRGLAWARAFARVREAFGKPLHTLPAHRATLTDIATDHAAAVALTMRCCALMGKVEHGSASGDEIDLLRGLTPLTKLSTARWAIAGATEAMESVGGVGYCEDSGLPAVVRNAHVLPIWEGTTNVLALDFLRAALRHGAFQAVVDAGRERVGPRLDDPAVGNAARSVVAALDEVSSRVARLAEDPAAAEGSARSVAMSLASTLACAELVEQGAWAAARGGDRTAAAANRLAERGLLAPVPPSNLDLAMDDDAGTELPAPS
ncbi:MAG TPA: acyl-CoA dehydrogenase family protein [Actinomycetota bacterium]|nr:acyl-CoA dehydrogenase family protein [Actinomycetota bacterium]